MAAITVPPTPSSLTSKAAAYTSPNFSAKGRLAMLVQAKIVLLNYKSGTNYIGNHTQLTIDAEAAYNGLTPESWAAGLGQSDNELDPGAATVGQFVQQANYRDSNNMPSTVASQVLLTAMQVNRPTVVLQKQNAFLDLLLMGRWG